ncbi:MAG: hypothetical protein OHK0039_40370 [Bacteroidia bacterium]
MRSLLWFLIGMLALAGCSDRHKGGTAAMAAELAEIARTATSIDYPYLNRYRADLLRAEIARDTLRADLRFALARELLYAGDAAAAIAELHALLGSEQDTVTYRNRDMQALLGLACLRLGETQNCIEAHHPLSCVVPIAPAARHRLTVGSQGAIEVFGRLLRRDPGDLQSRWLLNVAYMTLGRWPDEVPEAWRIPSAALASAYPLPAFRNVAPALGVAVNEVSGGTCLEDFDRDGDLDIFCTSFRLHDQARLFRNDGDGHFTDITAAAGLTGIVSGLNTLHADYDNDGWPDILILRGAWLNNSGTHPNSLLRNNGDGTFADVTRASGLYSLHPTQTAAWADVNLDGWLDLFIGNESNADAAHLCELYLANGDGTFREAAAAWGVALRGFVKGVCFTDYDNDSWPDLYVSQLGQPNLLFHNRAGQTFEAVTQAAGVSEPRFSFPVWTWDYDQDGHEDLAVWSYDTRRYGQLGYDVAADYLGLPHHAELPRIYRNRGDGTFEETSHALQLDKALFVMGCNHGDLDNDGWPDAYLGTGAPDLFSTVPNRLFRNAAGQVFQDVTAAAGAGQIQKGHAVAFGDLDNDGDQDIYTVIGGSVEGDVFPNMLLDNPGSSHAWVSLELKGRRANRSAIGARVVIETADSTGQLRRWYHSVSTGGSFGSNSLRIEAGLGKAASLRQVIVTWPTADRHSDHYTGLELRRHYRLVEGGEARHIERPVIIWDTTKQHLHMH